MNSFKIKLVIVFCLINFYANAQTLSLKTCLQKAYAAHPDLKLAYIQAEMANNSLAQSKSNFYPRISAAVYQSGNFGRSIDRFTNGYISKFYNSTYGGLDLNLPLFSGFQNKYTMAASKEQVLASSEGVSAAKNQLTLVVVDAYLSVLAQKELISVQEKQVKNVQIQKNRLEKRLASGMATKLEELQLTNQLKSDELNLIDANINYETLKIKLFQWLNMPFDATIGFEDIELTTTKYDLPAFDIAETVEKLPEIKQLALIEKSQAFGIKSLNATKLPSINLNGNYGLFYASSNPERTFTQQINDTRNGSFSLGFSFPILSSLSVNPKTQALKIQQRITHNTLEKSKLVIGQQIETTLSMFKASKKKYENALEFASLSESTLALVQQQKDIGTVSTVDFLLAQTNYEKASSAAIQAKYRLILQKMIVEFYQTGSFTLD
jgi:outer membrane protein